MDTRMISIDQIDAPLRITRAIDILDENRGFVVDQIEVFLGDQAIAYLKIENVPGKAYRHYYPSIFNYMAQIGGITGCMPSDERHLDYRTLDREDLVSLVCRSRRTQMPGSPAEYDGVTRDELLVIAREIEVYHLGSKYGTAMADFRAYHVDKPFVAYIQVEHAYRRKGLGTLLYAEADLWMRECNLIMRSSGTQTDKAKAVWDLFASLGLTTRDKQKRHVLRPSAAAVLRERIGYQQL